MHHELADASGGVDVRGNSNDVVNVAIGHVEACGALDVSALAGTSIGGAVLQS